MHMERIFDFASGDELCGQEEVFRVWARDVFETACKIYCITDERILADVTTLLDIHRTWKEDNVKLVRINQAKVHNIGAGLEKIERRIINTCKMSMRENLHAPTEDRKTILVGIDISQTNEKLYEPGDHIAICPANSKALVDSILERLKCSCPEPDVPVRVELKKSRRTVYGRERRWVPHELLAPCSLRQALTWFFDITTPPTQTLLGCLASTCDDTVRDKPRLLELTKEAAKYEKWKSHNYPNLLETLAEFPSASPPPALLFTQLPFQKPRFYSISSAPEVYPNAIHCTVAVVKYRTRHGKGPMHYGVCSNYLDSVPIGDDIWCFIRRAPFLHLPEDKSLPIIMVGPGTGIAPLRSFWQKRREDMKKAEKTSPKFGSMSLFVGCRSPEMMLYAKEIEDMEKEGVLTFVGVAYSRLHKTPKRYVQHVIRQSKETIYAHLVNENGHMYVCGDVGMAEGVAKEVIEIFEEKKEITQVEAAELLEKIRKENRYHEDIFGLTLNTAQSTKKGQKDAVRRFSVHLTPGQLLELSKLDLDDTEVPAAGKRN